MSGDTFLQQPGLVILILAFLSLAPFLLITATSFVKLSAVFSILRSALGTPQIPPNIVITGLSLILSIIIMMPVCRDVCDRFNKESLSYDDVLTLSDPEEILTLAANCITPPLRLFLQSHAQEDELMMVKQMADAVNHHDSDETSLMVILTAFILSELKEAFQIGFLIFLPFIIVDLVVANILQALGMVMMSPTTLSLPFKLLLFVLADGWYLIAEGLLSGYL